MQPSAILSADKRRTLSGMAAVAAVILAIGLIVSPERAWSSAFVAAFYLLTIGLGGALFVALTYVTGAGWNVAFRRVPEAMALIIPFAGAATVAVLALRIQQYGWHHHGEGGAGTFWFKELWLTPSFWFTRSIGYVIVWSLLAGQLVHRSRKQATASTGSALPGTVRLSAVFLIVYALTFSLASADWIMALEPMWFSTMWGVYNFSGMILAALAVTVILCIRLSKKNGPLRDAFRVEHLHDLGKLLVGFSCFWMYIWFSQYMLIWYSNIPEETSYFITRTNGPWGPVVVISIALNWLVPFFVLLPKPAKRSRIVMMRVAIVLLIGRWVDLYLMVYPSIFGETPVFGICELAAACCGTVAGIYLLDRAFRSGDPVPQNDVYLEESLHYHA
ncbi:hypothetical protein ACFL2H_07505 [Planctomycetota bacterium]